jgi:hypothetical protein
MRSVVVSMVAPLSGALGASQCVVNALQLKGTSARPLSSIKGEQRTVEGKVICLYRRMFVDGDTILLI